MSGALEHDDAVAAARAHLGPAGAAPLTPLPEGFVATRIAMHRVAEDVLKPKRELETGNEIALGFTPGGFGTPPWERGEASGRSGQARVEGLDLVVDDGAETTRTALEDPDLGGACAAALADWFAFGTVVLAALLERRPGLEPAPIRLWPEHFDVATDLGAEGKRANYGASPGDEEHPEPYLYVGPWDQSVAGELWDANSFTGAELAYRDLIAAPDQIGTATDFLTVRLDALAAG